MPCGIVDDEAVSPIVDILSDSVKDNVAVPKQLNIVSESESPPMEYNVSFLHWNVFSSAS